MLYYHGSDIDSINSIMQNGADIDKGGGELGKGFYIGSSMWRAFSWAWHKAKKINKDYAVIEFDFNDNEFVKLNIQYYNKSSALNVYENLKQNKNIMTWTSGKDAIWAPIVGYNIHGVLQIKFESKKGKEFINKQQKNKL